MRDKVYLASFYFLRSNIGWSIVEKEDGVFKSGSINKDEFTSLYKHEFSSFLDSNEEDFKMCDYIVFNEISKLTEKEIIRWFSTRKGVSIMLRLNPFNPLKESELQANNFFKEYKNNNLDKIKKFIKIYKK